MNAQLPANWKTWVLESLLKGVPPMDILKQLLSKGFTFEQAKTALGNNLPKNINYTKNAAFYRRISQPALIRNLDSTRAYYLESDRAQVLQIDEFLYPHQCEQVIALSQQHLTPSKVASKEGFSAHRTSSTCELSEFDDELVNKINQHIVNTMGVGVGENETIQAQHYAIGQEFKLHSDYFDPATEGWELQAKQRGQRTWTFMIYLNGACTGGETEFPALNLKVKPKQGSALIWNNLYPDGTPNSFTKHLSHPIQSGEKVVITKWFRDQKQ